MTAKRRRKLPNVERVIVVLPCEWVDEINKHVEAAYGQRGWRGNVNKSDIIRRALRKGLDAMKSELETAAE